MKPLLSLAVVFGLTHSLALTEQPDAAHGYWLTQNGKAIIHMVPCGAQTCGQMVWTASPRDEAGKLKLDVKNNDDALRARPVCGLQLVGGMKLKDAGSWQDGWIYNPRDGETYSAEISAVSADELKVRGFLGIKLLGKSQIWTRVTDDRGGC
ncbi:MAG: DUF2147 domain-containing protein [Pseudomonadota bacterium]